MKIKKKNQRTKKRNSKKINGHSHEKKSKKKKKIKSKKINGHSREKK